MMIAIDTNILVYAVMQEDPHHRPSRNLVEAAARGLVSACVFPQNLLEFYAVVTSPRRVSRPLSTHDALLEISNLRAIFHVVNPKESSLDCLFELVAAAQTTQADVFDAFVVAQMRDAAIETICTYNKQDFLRFSVEARTPEEILDSLGIRQDLVHDRPGMGPSNS